MYSLDPEAEAMRKRTAFFVAVNATRRKETYRPMSLSDSSDGRSIEQITEER
jgi:hypothetical protein